MQLGQYRAAASLLVDTYEQLRTSTEEQTDLLFYTVDELIRVYQV